MKVYSGILAGGSGERLWPLSTHESPKQFIPFIDKKSLLALTVERLDACKKSNDEIFVITGSSFVSKVKQHADSKIDFVIEEPVGRNTAPAILLSCLQVYQKDQDSIVSFFPADHFIPERDKFCRVIQQAVAYVKDNDVIATLGFVPTYPGTGYGYIQAGMAEEKKSFFYPAKKFHEKPNLKKAQQYLAQENMFWNAGMFLAKTSVLLKAFELHAPILWSAMQDYISGGCSYNSLEKESVDYAIMEKSKNIVVFTADFEWYDVGNINVFLKIKSRYEEKASNVINVDASNNLAYTDKKVVACIGIENLCIVETDDVLLITSCKSAEKVKEVSVLVDQKSNEKSL